jgi:ankyrin repeat protein
MFEEELFSAVREGNINTLRNLLQKGGSPNAQDDSKMTLLHVAARSGHNEIVKVLIQHHANVDDSTCRVTPLHLATQYNYIEVIKTLVESNANVDAVNFQGRTPLHIAYLYGREEIVTYLMTHGANSKVKDIKENVPNDLENVTPPKSKGNADSLITLLHYAVRDGQNEMVKILIKRKVNINASSGGDTPLHVAAQYNYVEIVKTLLQNNANVNVVNFKGRTPLHIAYLYGREEIITYLLKYGANPNVLDINNNVPNDLSNILPKPKIILQEESKNEISKPVNVTIQPPLVKLPNENTNKNIKPAQKTEEPKQSVKINVPPPAPLKNHESDKKLIIKGRVFSHEEAEDLFKNLKTNTTVTELDLSGCTIPASAYPAFLEMINQNTTLKQIDHQDCKLLDLEISSASIDAAYRNGEISKAQQLINYGLSDIKDRDLFGSSYLHFSCYYHDYPMAKKLIEQGADIHSKDFKGITPYDIICEKPNSLIKSLMVKKINIEVMKGNWLTKEIDLIDQIINQSLESQFSLLANNTIVKKLTIKPRLFHPDEAESLFNALKTNTTLEELDLTDCVIPSSDFSFIVEMLAQNKTLKHIESKGCELLSIAIASLSPEKSLTIEESVKIDLHAACNDNDYANVKVFLEEVDSNLDLTDSFGNTPLHIACAKGHLEIVKLLLDKNANAEIKNIYGNTPLHLVSAYSHSNDFHEIAKLLLGKRVNINFVNNSNCSPLSLACKYENKEMVKLLWEKQADFSMLDNEDISRLLNLLTNDNVLDLSRRKLKGHQLSQLAIGLNNDNIKTLILSVNAFSHWGMSKLADALKTNKNLITLDLSKNNIGNRSVGYSGFQYLIDALYENRTIQYIDVTGCELDKADIKYYIKFLKEQKNIQFIQIKFDDSVKEIVNSLSVEEKTLLFKAHSASSFFNALNKIENCLPKHDEEIQKLIESKIPNDTQEEINKLTKEEKISLLGIRIGTALVNLREEFLSQHEILNNLELKTKSKNPYLENLTNFFENCANIILENNLSNLVPWMDDIIKIINEVHLPFLNDEEKKSEVQSVSEKKIIKIFKKSFINKMADISNGASTINSKLVSSGVQTPIENVAQALKKIISALTSVDKIVEGIGEGLDAGCSALQMTMLCASGAGKFSQFLNGMINNPIVDKGVKHFKDNIIRFFHDGLTEEDKFKYLVECFYGNKINKIKTMAHAISHHYYDVIKNFSPDEADACGQYVGYHTAHILIMLGNLYKIELKLLSGVQLGEEAVLWLSYGNFKPHIVRVKHGITAIEKETFRKYFMQPKIKFYKNDEDKMNGIITTCSVVAKHAQGYIDCQEGENVYRWATQKEIDALNEWINLSDINTYEQISVGEIGINQFIFDKDELSEKIKNSDNVHFETELSSYMSQCKRIVNIEKNVNTLKNEIVIEQNKIIDEISKKMETRDKDVEELNKKLEKRDMLIDELIKKMEKRDSNTEKLTKKLEDRDKDVEELNKKLEKRDAIIDELIKKMEKLDSNTKGSIERTEMIDSIIMRRNLSSRMSTSLQAEQTFFGQNMKHFKCERFNQINKLNK